MTTKKAGREFAGIARRCGAAATHAAPTLVRTARRARAAPAGWRQARRRLEHAVATLSAANAALLATNDELTGFAYAAVHDLRAPLRAIDGFSRTLVEGYGDKLDREGWRLLGAVRDGARRINRLIDDMLVLCRVGHEAMRLAPVDMAALLADALAAPPVSAAGRAALDIGTLPPVRGDRGLLEHVWLNLLDNAGKFSAANPDARIEVGGAANDGEVRYYVRDNGVGFDMRCADRLFVPFQRLHGNAFAGTGIGLAIVKRVVERHGGRVWAEGRPGEGATFYFALPE
jgi:light-regulated signal transduction histidine kinase (bacteriophytochrome)